MLEFYHHGKSHQIFSIERSGKVGQAVFYPGRKYFGKDEVPVQHPLWNYIDPCIFTIVDKIGNYNGYYLLQDSNGTSIQVPLSSCDTRVLFDAQDWLNWHEVRNSARDEEIKQLKHDVELLKGILTAQGFRVLTPAQAKQLGL